MKLNLSKSLLLLIVLISALFSLNPNKVNASQTFSGKIFLQTEENGEAWYIYPWDGKRYYLGRPAEAFEIMRKLSLGAKHDFINSNEYFPKKLSGVILLDVEKNGEAYYINPQDLKKYYLGRPNDAFEIMRNLGIGISNEDLSYIPIGDLNKVGKNEEAGRYIVPGVSFSPQAPFANWKDERQQDGCEEASALMAVYWALNKKLTRQETLDKIIESAQFLEEKYGEYRDISTKDTVDWIFKDFLGYDKVVLKKNINKREIIYEIKKGNLVVTPMNGQTLGNIYYTPPGPERHMILIRGYDENRQTFITNDPGVGNGEFFEYNEDVFYNSIRDYYTGYHIPIKTEGKNAIVIWK